MATSIPILTPIAHRFSQLPLSQRRAVWGILLVAPNVIGLMIFFGIPVLISFFTSLQQWNGISAPTFVGISNFIGSEANKITGLINDPDFWKAFGNSVKLLLLVVPAEIIIALLVALALNQRIPGRIFLRVLYFLPVVTSTVAASVVWTWIFQPRYGLVGNLFAPFGWRDVNWITRPDLVLIPIAIVTIWQRVGFDMILLLAGLQNIPKLLYEAATIDGANRWQRLRYITLPMLSPTLFLVIVLATIGAFQIFDQVYIMTARITPGGIDGSATTLSYFLYRTAFTSGEYGYSSAIALVLFLIILAFTIFQLRVQRRWVYYESDGR